MVNVYNENDYITVKKQKRNFLKWFFISLTAVLAVCISMFVVYTLQEFNTPLKAPLLAITIAITAIYGGIYYVLLAVKYKRIKSYYMMLYYFQHGLKAQNANAFVRVDSSITTKDGVDFISLVFLEWSEKKQDYFERHVLYDIEKPIPDFKRGDFVKFTTQANKMIAYELSSNEIFE